MAQRLVIVPAVEDAGEYAGREAQALKNLRRPLPLAAHHTEAHDADDPLRQRDRDGDRRLEVEATQGCAVDAVRQLVGAREADQLAGQELREHPREAFPGRHPRGRRGKLGTPPAVCAEQIPVIAALVQRAAVEIERFHDAALSLMDGGVGDVPFGECNSKGHAIDLHRMGAGTVVSRSGELRFTGRADPDAEAQLR